MSLDLNTKTFYIYIPDDQLATDNIYKEKCSEVIKLYLADEYGCLSELEKYIHLEFENYALIVIYDAFDPSFKTQNGGDEFWIPCCIVKKQASITFVSFHHTECVYESTINKVLDYFQEVVHQKLNNCDPIKKRVIIKDIEIHYYIPTALTIVLSYLNDDASLNYYDVFMNVALANHCETKTALTKLLKVLNFVINKDDGFKLGNDEVIELGRHLVFDNIVSQVPGEDDLRKDILRVLSVMKSRGSKIKPILMNYISEYYECESKKKYCDNLNRLLAGDCRNTFLQKEYGKAIEEYLELLNYVGQLNAKAIPCRDIDDFVSMLGSKNSMSELQNKKKDLEQELYFIQYEDNDNDENRFLWHKKLKIIEKITILQKQLDYIVIKIQITQSLNIDNLIMLLANKLTNDYTLHDETIETIVNYAAKARSDNIFGAVFLLLNSTPKDKIIHLPADMFKRVLAEDSTSVVDFSFGRKFSKETLPTVLEFMYKILTDNNNTEIRLRVLKVLESSEYPKHLRQVIEIEQFVMKYNTLESIYDEENPKAFTVTSAISNFFRSIMSYFKPNDINMFFKLCLKLIETKMKLPLDCFLVLNEHIENIYSVTILNKIVRTDFQKLPGATIETLKERINSVAINGYNDTLLDFCSNLIISHYIDIHDLKDLALLLSEDNELSNKVLEMIFKIIRTSESCCKIPDDIIAEIYKISSQNELAMNILIVINEHTSTEFKTSINPRCGIAERLAALMAIARDANLRNTHTFKALECIILHERKLQVQAFRTLTSILPSSFDKRDLDFPKMLKALLDTEITINDVELLASKTNDMKILSCLVDFLLSRLASSTKEQFETQQLLPKLCLKIYINDQQLLNLIIIAFSVTNGKVRNTICEIIDCYIDRVGNYVPIDLYNKLKYVNALKYEDNANDVASLKDIVMADRLVVTDDTSFKLIKMLETDNDHRDLIANTLHLIHDNQIFTKEVLDEILAATLKNKNLFTSHDVIYILIESLESGYINIRELVSEEFCLNLEEALSNQVHDVDERLLLKLHTLMPSGGNIRFVKKLVDHIIHSGDIESKIWAARNLCKMLQLLDTVSSARLQEYILNIIDYDEEEFSILNTNVFRCFEYEARYNQIRDGFFENYCDRLIIRLLKHSRNDDKPLKYVTLINDFVKNTSASVLDKYNLLSAANNILTICKEMPLHLYSNVMNCNDLLTIELLARATQTDGNLDELEMASFSKNLETLFKFIIEIKSENSVPHVLQYIIDKQFKYNLSLYQINDIIVMLMSRNRLILVNTESNTYCEQLKEKWVAALLSDMMMAVEKSLVKILLRYMHYRPQIIKQCLSYLKEGTSMFELIDFFKETSMITEIDVQEILIFDLNKISTLEDWKHKINERIVEELINKKFSFYKTYYRHLNKNKLLQKNAYNQSGNSYKYRAADVEIILSELLKDQTNDLRVIKPMSLHPKKKFSDTLANILSIFNEDKKPLLMPLIVSEAHWIAIAIVYHDKTTYVLCKDSYGSKFIQEQGDVRYIFNYLLPGAIFLFNACAEQRNSYCSGEFVLNNLKCMAEELLTDASGFIAQFVTYEFTTQKEANKMHKEIAPRMYSQSVVFPIIKQAIIKHHKVELERIKELIAYDIKKASVAIDATEATNVSLNVSLDLTLNNNLLDCKYDYDYIIEIGTDVDLSQIKKDICTTLQVEEVDVIELNKFKISQSNLFSMRYRENKLNVDIRQWNSFHEEVREALQGLNVACTDYSTEVFKYHLGLQDRSDLDIIPLTEYKLLISLQKTFVNMISLEWSVNSIVKILNRIESQNCLEMFLHAAMPIYEYHLKEWESNVHGKSVLSVMMDEPVERWATLIHELAMFRIFQGTYKKDLNQLNQEIIDVNKDDPSYILQSENICLIKEFEHVHHASLSRSIKFPNCPIISEWSALECKKWARHVKKVRGINVYENIAVIKRALEISIKCKVRDIQVISLLTLIYRKNEKGRLVQINTGEGKTIIIAMLAAFLALNGHTVDVITSSPELARPQMMQNKYFYNILNLTVYDNGPDDSVTDIKKRYKADVLYGTAYDFQADILRDEYSKMGTRSGRTCDVAIVDEVDSMLIDGKDNIIMLSSPIPAMDHLEPVLAEIWSFINLATSCIVERNGQTYILDIQDAIDKKRPDNMRNAKPIDCTKAEFIKRSTDYHIRKLLRDVESTPDDETQKNYPQIKIPLHLRELVIKVQLSRWIDSAIYAKFQCENGKNYILKDGQIAPVDVHNTGVVQRNMHWNNGLHQFLQIKHGTKITPERLTTNYMSNVTYFRRYGSNIYGLTGTLGSKVAKELLNKIYNLDSVVLPPFKQKQYYELAPIILTTKCDWHSSIVESCLNKVHNHRAVLIITKYIDEADELYRIFKEDMNYAASQLKIYRTEMDSEVVVQELKPGDIIIATNIAGRGTDLKPTEQVESFGGLHVCITFLPSNQRVEKQNVGRTSRTGNRGTAQFVIVKSKCAVNDIQAMRIERDIIEENALKVAEQDIQIVIERDVVFEKFCVLLNDIIGIKCENKQICIKAIEERFGIWLKIQESTKTEAEESLLKNFEHFKEDIIRDYNKNKYIQNPYFYILSGNQFMRNHKYKESISEYAKAITMDEYFTANAFYNRAYALIANHSYNGEADKAHLLNAISDLNQAAAIITNNLEPMLHIIQRASNSTVLSEQVRHKMLLYKTQICTIMTAINVVKTAQENNQSIDVAFSDINKSVPDDEDIDTYKNELDEYAGNGFMGNFKVTCIAPISWGKVMGLACLGLVQMVAGAALAVFTMGAASGLGFSIMLEGVRDIVTAVEDGINHRCFDWTAWGINKAISLVISMACAGFSALKFTAKAVISGSKTVACSGMTTAVETTTGGWVLVGRAIGVALGKEAAKKTVSVITHSIVQEKLMPIINIQIMQKIEEPIKYTLKNNEIVCKMLKLDFQNRNQKYWTMISETAMKQLGTCDVKQNILLKNVLRSAYQLGVPLMNTKIDGLSAFFKSTEMLTLLNEVINFVPKFLAQLDTELSKIELTSESQESIEMQIQDVISEIIPTDMDDDIDLVLGTKTEEIVIFKHDENTSDCLCEKLSRQVSVHICKLIHQILAPAINAGIALGVNEMSAGLENNISNTLENYYAEQRIATFQDKDIDERIPDKYKTGINKVDTMMDANNILMKLSDGGEAGLYHLGAISDIIDSPIFVIDERDHVKHVIGKEKFSQPVYVQYHQPKGSNESGHWTLPGGKESRVGSPGRQDCLFNTIAAQTGASPEQLREQTVLQMRTNINIIANQIQDIKLLERFKELALCMGGMPQYYGTDSQGAKEVLDESQGARGYTRQGTSIGHPRGHASGSNSYNVQQFSRDDTKTAFASEAHQDRYTHQCLTTPEARDALEKMNNVVNPSLRQPIFTPVRQLSSVPYVYVWHAGVCLNSDSPLRAAGIQTVIQNHDGQQNNPDYNVHVLTVYPKPESMSDVYALVDEYNQRR